MQEEPSEAFTKVKEGKAEILFPNANCVFYNPVQEFNRDITIAVLKEYVKTLLQKRKLQTSKSAENESQSENSTNPVKKNTQKGVKILEALSATGLRSIRFAKEIPGVDRIVANDMSEDAFEAIKRNVTHNNVDDVVSANKSDATIYMYQHRDRDDQFDVVDVDPYGSASIFLDAAVQSVKHGGLLCVTCTDMAVFSGNFPEVAWSKYQSMPLRTKACHEQALRMLLGSISAHAARYSRYIEPVVSISVDFYVRVFVRVWYGPSRVKEVASKQVYVYRCVGCSSFYTQPVADCRLSGQNKHYHAAVGPSVNKVCEQCNQRQKMGGPFWGDPLHNVEFVKEILKSIKTSPSQYGSHERMTGILSMITEELQDVPFFYVSDELSKTVKCNAPPTKILRSAILNAGYRVSAFHGRINSVKTDAPPPFLWDVMRKWVASENMNKSKLKENSTALAILEKPITNENISFEIHPEAKFSSEHKGITRFPVMPPNWGPKARAKMNKDGSLSVSESLKEKSKKFQGKRKKNFEEENIDKRQKASDDVKTIV